MGKSRKEGNKLVMDEIQDILEKKPDLRFNQLMSVLNEAKAFGQLFNEEPEDTLARIKDKRKRYNL